MADRILSKSDIYALVGVSDVTIRDWEARGLFPARFKLCPGGKRIGWSEIAVQKWIAERAGTLEAA